MLSQNLLSWCLNQVFLASLLPSEWIPLAVHLYLPPCHLGLSAMRGAFITRSIIFDDTLERLALTTL